jgi:ADP-ribose pyrophosphatase
MPWHPSFGPEPPHATTTGTHRMYESPWISVRKDDIIHPSGTVSDRHVAERPPSVVIIPVTTDDHVLLVRQWRHAANQHLIELPAGLIDPGETIEATARRELQEETGHAAGNLVDLTTAYLSPGFTDEVSTFVLATGCTPVATEHDPDEPLQVARVPLARIPDLLQPGNGIITQAQCMIGLLWLLRLRDLR